MNSTSEEELQKTAHELARAMAQTVDPNEVGKVLAFWRRWRDPSKVFDLLKLLPESGLVRTGQTKGYYISISRALNQHLRNRPPDEFGYILGWAFRLMRYYQKGEKSTSEKGSSRSPRK